MAFEGQEKRKDLRVLFPCKVIIHSPQGTLITHVEDISKGGVKVILEKGLKHLSSVGLEIFLQKENSIRCQGRVVWIMERANLIDKTSSLYHTGIAFIKINHQDRAAIKEIVATVLKKKIQDLPKPGSTPRTIKKEPFRREG